MATLEFLREPDHVAILLGTIWALEDYRQSNLPSKRASQAPEDLSTQVTVPKDDLNQDSDYAFYPTTAAQKCLHMDHIISQIFSYLQEPEATESAFHNRHQAVISFIQVNRDFRELAKRLVYVALRCHISRVWCLNELLSSNTFFKGVQKETIGFVRSLHLFLDSSSEYGLFLPEKSYGLVKTLLSRLNDAGNVSRVAITGHSRMRSRFTSDYVCGDIVHWDALQPLATMKSLGTLRIATIVTPQIFEQLNGFMRDLYKARPTDNKPSTSRTPLTSLTIHLRSIPAYLATLPLDLQGRRNADIEHHLETASWYRNTNTLSSYEYPRYISNLATVIPHGPTLKDLELVIWLKAGGFDASWNNGAQRFLGLEALNLDLSTYVAVVAVWRWFASNRVTRIRAYWSSDVGEEEDPGYYDSEEEYYRNRYHTPPNYVSLSDNESMYEDNAQNSDVDDNIDVRDNAQDGDVDDNNDDIDDDDMDSDSDDSVNINDDDNENNNDDDNAYSVFDEDDAVEEAPRNEKFDAKYGKDEYIGRVGFEFYPNLKALAVSAASMNNLPLPEENVAHPLQKIVHLRLESTQRNWPTLKDCRDKDGHASNKFTFRRLCVERLAKHLQQMTELRCLEFDWLVEKQKRIESLGVFLKEVLSTGQVGIVSGGWPGGRRSLREVAIRLTSRTGAVEECKELDPMRVLATILDGLGEMHDLRALRVLDERELLRNIHASVPSTDKVKKRSAIPRTPFNHPLELDESSVDANFPPQLEYLVWRVDGFERAYRVEGVNGAKNSHDNIDANGSYMDVDTPTATQADFRSRRRALAIPSTDYENGSDEYSWPPRPVESFIRCFDERRDGNGYWTDESVFDHVDEASE